MAKCESIKINLDDSKYSAPVPVIGLYITGATLVCFAFMFYDILSGFVHRKRWIPCRLFSLNSVTLTLLGVTAKLPVDLTTPMPSALDQFSKLTGTTIICACMAFLLPSLGINQNSECLTNMAAMTIFVVTIVVNICIQIRTGLIFLFIPEHIIIMCCMLFLLILLWNSALDINFYKEGVPEVSRGLLKLFQGSLLHRLQLAYMFGYSNNPQFLLCKSIHNEPVAPLCTLCLVVIIQAASRSLHQLKFCRGVSDYDWSIWIIVVTQVLTITLACFATYIRIITWFKSNDKLVLLESDLDTNINFWWNPVLRNSISTSCGFAVETIMKMVVYLPWFVILIIKEGLRHLLMEKIKEDNNEIMEYKEACRKVEDHLVEFDEWSLEKSVKARKKWMESKQKQKALKSSVAISFENTSLFKTFRCPGNQR